MLYYRPTMFKRMETEAIIKAKELAYKVHENHFRLSGESYFDHASRVVDLLQETGINDEETLIAAYFHHALDVAPKNYDLIHKEFGENVANIVKEYNELSGGNISSIDPNTNGDTIVQTYFNLIKNQKTLIIRLADKVDNIKSVYTLPKVMADKVAQKALILYSPISQLLGIGKFTKVLEDQALKILNPGEYYKIVHYVEDKLPEIQDTLKDTSQFIKEILAEKGIKAKVEHRVKHVYSIHKKLLTLIAEGKAKDLSGVYDIAAMRVLVNTVEECYAVEGILKQIWDDSAGKRDDYITHPKPSGYKSLHNTFQVKPGFMLEIQIKTHQMHEENEFGVASHTFYKTGETLKKKMFANPNWLKEINFGINRAAIKIDQFTDNVYVFTPKGDIKELPRGANLIDFAYYVHNDLGNSCIGGVVNGELQKLTYELQDGDRVEIKTSKNRKKPSPDWEDVVKTKRAKDEIRRSLKEVMQY